MTFKITVVLRVSGRIDAEHVSELRACLLRYGPNVVLDLDEVQRSMLRSFVSSPAAKRKGWSCAAARATSANGWAGSDRENLWTTSRRSYDAVCSRRSRGSRIGAPRLGADRRSSRHGCQTDDRPRAR